jgi:acetoin:2,6-dichlorophenolindophenol oxidoreductase subunit alpha
MLRIRLVQLRIESLYHLDEMKTPVHLCIGQEAVAAGVCAALEKDDYITSNHRGHGHYLAKGGDLKRMIAELYCRETGCSKGRGGSMHLVDVSVGHLGSSSIVAGGISIGAGLALAIKMRKLPRVSVIFFGDGAADEGVLYESLNFAMLKKLPAIFVLENNQWAVCSRDSTRQSHENVFHSAPREQLMTASIDGNSVRDVYDAAAAAVARARAGDGPSFIECKTYRLRGHAGAGSDANLGYRTDTEISEWESKCPVSAFREKLLSDGILHETEISEMEKEIKSEIDEAFDFAQKSPLPKKEDVGLYLFKE